MNRVSSHPTCDVCGYPVRDVTKDYGPDGDHSPCAAIMRRMRADLERRQTPPWEMVW